MSDDIKNRVDSDIQRQVAELQASDIFKRVKEVQASTVESAKSFLEESELGHLRCLVRLAVDFHYYLERGSVHLATSVLEGPYAKYVPDARSASADPFNKYDLQFICESIRSGVDSFCALSARYSALLGATDSRVGWDMVSSKESFKAHFTSMFNKFIVDMNFESKCRLLLDLFKLQMVFAGLSYDG
jgi:hypothetical protein